MKNVKTLLDPTYQILKIAVLSQSFTPGQPMSTTVDIGADAETKGYTMYNYTCTHGERSLMTSLVFWPFLTYLPFVSASAPMSTVPGVND